MFNMKLGPLGTFTKKAISKLNCTITDIKNAMPGPVAPPPHAAKTRARRGRGMRGWRKDRPIGLGMGSGPAVKHEEGQVRIACVFEVLTRSGAAGSCARWHTKAPTMSCGHVGPWSKEGRRRPREERRRGFRGNWKATAVKHGGFWMIVW